MYFVVVQRTIDVLKVDVEIAEWPFLRDVVINNPDDLSDVRQFIIEIHAPKYRETPLDTAEFVEMNYYFEQLLTPSERSRFVVYQNVQRSYCCARFADMMPSGVSERCCHEVFLLNMRFAST